MPRAPKTQSAPGDDGGFSTPPSGAPKEVTQPASSVSPADIEAAQARARERAAEKLSGQPGHAPLRPPPSTLGQPPSPAPQEQIPALMGQPVAPQEQEGQTHIEGVQGGIEALTEEFLALHPAASETDSPSRGVPQPIGDPGKQITGGWGPSGGSAEYFALDGLELKKVVLALADRLKQALDGDLRFGLSVVYPQVKVSLVLTVDGLPGTRDEGQTFQIQDHRVLTLQADVEDSDSTPAGKIRDDFDLASPGKRLVQAGAAKMLVDVPV